MRRYSNKKVFITLLLSFGSLVLLLTSMIVIIYLSASSIVIGQTSDSNLMFVNNVRDNLDYRISEIKQFAFQVTAYPGLSDLFGRKSFDDVQSKMGLKKILEDFRSMHLYNKLIDDFYLYLIESDTIISSTSTADSELWFEHMHSGGSYTYQEWKTLVSSLNTNTSINIPTNVRGTYDGEKALFVYSVMSRDLKNVVANIVVIVDANRFTGTFSDISKTNDTNLLVLNEKDDIIISTGEYAKNIERSDLEEINGENGSFVVKNNDSVLLISYIAGNNGWKYILIKPDELYWYDVYNLRRIMLVCFILFFIQGVVATIIFANKNYRPIKNIIAYATSIAGVNQDSLNDEYSMILKSMEYLAVEKDKASSLIQKNRNELYNNMVSNLLTENITMNENSALVYQQFNITFDDGFYAVILIRIEDYGRIFGENSEFSDVSLRLSSYAVANISEECINLEFKGYAANCGEELGCIVNMPKDQNNIPEKLQSIADKIIKLVYENLEISLTAAISDIFEGASDIHLAYLQAKEVLELRIIHGKGGILTVSSLMSGEGGYKYSYNNEQKLLNHIKSGELENSLQYLDSIFKENKNHITTVRDAQCFLYEFKGAILKIIKLLNVTDNSAMIIDVLRCETIDEVKTKAEKIIDELCATINMQKSEDKLSDSIIGYIKLNFYDVNLNVARLGDLFDLTPSYLSKLFFEQTGVLISDFIQNTRITKAKAYIEDGKYSIKEIAEKTGFSTSNVFIRTFKRTEGITPGKYKNIVSEKNK